MTSLFFDDHRLFGRDGLVRRYGVPRLLVSYTDGVSSTDLCGSWCFRLDDGRYRLLYMGRTEDKINHLFSAIGTDGVHFTPEPLALPQASYPHEIPLPFAPGCEVAAIYEDPISPEPDSRYRLLFTKYSASELYVHDVIYRSPDLIHWTLDEGSWGDGAEPLASVFYNERTRRHTVMERPFWGVRRIGYKTTEDFKTFSEYRNCLLQDAQDEALAELYGIFAFAYEGMFVGALHLYRALHAEYNSKYDGGIVDTQLAYSYDGEYWMRSLRTPFLSGLERTPPRSLAWISGMNVKDDAIRLYSTSSQYEHGKAFHTYGTGHVDVWELRKDGFVCLATEQGKCGSLITREQLWQGGEMSWNLKGKRATVAIFETGTSTISGDVNVIACSTPLAGYTHEECIPFSGDTTAWTPTWCSGKTLDELKGKTLIVELRLEDGEVYALRGSFHELYNTEAARYRVLGVLPR